MPVGLTEDAAAAVVAIDPGVTSKGFERLTPV